MEPDGRKRLAVLGGAALMGGVSLLAPRGGDLWEALAAAPSLLEPGAAGLWLWRAVYGALGVTGICAVRVLLAAALSAAILAGGGRLAARAGCALALVLLLPWGPCALFFPLLAVSLLLARRRPLLAFLVCAAWPCLEGSFLAGGLLTALACALPIRRAWAFALAPLLNPVALGAIWNGQAFVFFAAAWARHPGFAAPRPDSPAFWLAALWGTSAVALSFAGGRRLAAASCAAVLGVALKPMGALPAALSAQGPDDRGAPLWPALLTVPLALWLVAGPRPDAPPEKALALLGSLPEGRWTLLADPAWSAPLALRFGRERVAPGFSTPELLRFRDNCPKGLVPPFEGESLPPADLLLLAPAYPARPFPQDLAQGWSLIGAGTRYALFARETPLLSGWVGRNRLRYYSPFSPPPDPPAERRLALDEARRLLEGDPGFFEALRDAGRMETDFEMTADAAARLRKALAIAPKSAQLWNDLGAALQIGGDTQGATEAYARSVALDGSELLPRFNLASLLLQTEKPAEAEEVLKAVIAARPRATIAYRRLAQVLVREGKVDEARETLERIPPDMRLPEDAEILTGPPR